MIAFLRTLPNTLWWITLFLAVVAFFTQIGIAVARSGAVSVQMLLAEFVFTLVSPIILEEKDPGHGEEEEEAARGVPE